MVAGPGPGRSVSTTGRDALRLARLPVDAVVLDLVLQDMDGHEVLERLKADATTRDIPVILKTAVRVDDGDRQRGLDAGAGADPGRASRSR